MTRRVFAILALSLTTAVLVAGPSRYGFSDRVERHLFPEVTTGPDNPTWSPDGAWIAFSMQGDIWKIPTKGGEAIALTKGPSYYFEPAWSRDSQDLYFVSARGGRGFDIFKLHVADRVVTPVVSDPGDQTQPAVSPDGLTL